VRRTTKPRLKSGCPARPTALDREEELARCNAELDAAFEALYRAMLSDVPAANSLMI
jgi:hypothetical protein